MRISIHENPIKPGTYRIVLHPGKRASFEEFLKHIEGATAMTRADALGVLTAAAQWVQWRAESGREADLGPLGRSRLGMKGKFDKLPERIEDSEVSLTISWLLPGKLKRAVAKEGARLVRERIAPSRKFPNLAEARRIMPNALPDDVPGRYTPGGAMRIHGAKLDFDQSQPDEGAFLVTHGGVETRLEQAFIVEPQQIIFLMPGDAAGEYRLLVRRRHPAGHGELMEGTLKGVIVPV